MKEFTQEEVVELINRFSRANREISNNQINAWINQWKQDKLNKAKELLKKEYNNKLAKETKLLNKAKSKYPIGTALTSHFGVDLIVTNETEFYYKDNCVFMRKGLKIKSFVVNNIRKTYDSFIIYDNNEWSLGVKLYSYIELNKEQQELIKLNNYE